MHWRIDLQNALLTMLALLACGCPGPAGADREQGLLQRAIAKQLIEAIPKKSANHANNWHQRVGWRAEDYFEDPLVQSLCVAIEANDLKEMDRLIDAGADVNALGKDNMTPLMWAFPDNNLARFSKLLEHGANPNVYFGSDFGTRGAMTSAGSSVTHMACQTVFEGYFEAVFAHGGDPNLRKKTPAVAVGEAPLVSLIHSPVRDKISKLQTLLDKGADLNYANPYSRSCAVNDAVGWGGQYEIALFFLNCGAHFDRYFWPIDNRRLIHSVARERERAMASPPERRAAFEALVQWLESHGQSLEEAKVDLREWREFIDSNGRSGRSERLEVIERKLREGPRDAAGYFDDPQVVALCYAIDADDVAEIDRLIDSGADVKAVGRFGMTPLLRAFPELWRLEDPPGRLAVFTRLLERGANPNVLVEVDFQMYSDGLEPGDSVAHLAVASVFPGYWRAVFTHGGDPNLKRENAIYYEQLETPFFEAICSRTEDSLERVRFLISKGADLDHRLRSGNNSAMEAVTYGGRFEIALELLEAGARFDFTTSRTNKRLVHLVIEERDSQPPERHAACQKLLDWLEQHGESVNAAEREIEERKRKSQGRLR